MPAQFETAESNSVSGPASLTINKPTGLAVDELMVGVVAHHFFAQATTPPAGWTKVQEFSHPQGTPNVTLAFKVAEAADVAATDFTFTRTGASGAVFIGGILRISGIDTADPIDIHGFDTDDTFATQVDCPDITTTVDGCLLLRVGQAFSDVPAGIVAHSIGSGVYTEQIDIRDLGSREFGIAFYTIDTNQPTAGATGIETITAVNLGANPGVTGLTVAIAPAALSALSLTKHLFRRRRTF